MADEWAGFREAERRERIKREKESASWNGRSSWADDIPTDEPNYYGDFS